MAPFPVAAHRTGRTDDLPLRLINVGSVNQSGAVFDMLAVAQQLAACGVDRDQATCPAWKTWPRRRRPVAPEEPPHRRPTSSRIMYAVGTSTSVISVANSTLKPSETAIGTIKAVNAGLAHRQRETGRLEVPPAGRDSPGLPR